MRQHDENEENTSKKSSEWWVFVEILKIFRKLPDDLIYCFIMFFDALEVQEHPQSDSGSIWDHLFFHHFHHYFHDFSQTCELYISGALCPFPLKPVQILVCLYKENTTKQHYLFLFIAPLINSIQVQKITNNIKNMSLGAWEQVLWLVPGWPRITLKEHRYMLYESFKVTLEARRMATHASAWRKW